MNERQDLIASLSSGLQSVKPSVNIDRMAFMWLVVSGLYVVGVVHLFGPIRPTAMAQLANESRFLMETLCGGLAIVIVALVAFRAAVPGALSSRLTSWGLGLMVVWVGCYLVGLYSPALEPSMLGKRPHCAGETIIYGMPPVLLAFALTRRLYPLQPVRTAVSFSLASGMMPALYMQIACMYSPSHALQFHILPGLLVAVLGTTAAWIAWRSGVHRAAQ